MSYAAIASRSLALIKRKGGTVTFPGAIQGTPDVYDPTTDTTTPGTPPTDATGNAVQIDGDPDKLAALSLILVRSVTLLVAASGLAITPAPNMAMTWGSVGYSIVTVDPTTPDGDTVILYTIIARAG